MKVGAAARWERNLYRILVALATLQMAYTLYWVGLEVLGRLGLWPASLVGFDLAAFLQSESLFNRSTFTAFAVLYSIAYVLILQRRKAAVWFVALAFIVGRLDWVGLSLNVIFDNFVGGALEIGLQGAILMLCLALRGRGVLR